MRRILRKELQLKVANFVYRLGMKRGVPWLRHQLFSAVLCWKPPRNHDEDVYGEFCRFIPERAKSILLSGGLSQAFEVNKVSWLLGQMIRSKDRGLCLVAIETGELSPIILDSIINDDAQNGEVQRAALIKFESKRERVRVPVYS